MRQVIDKSHLSLRLTVYIGAIDDEVTARIASASVAFSVFCSVFIHFAKLCRASYRISPTTLTIWI